MRHKVQGGTLRRPLRFSRVNRPLPPNCLAVPYIICSVPGWELRRLVSILNHKPKRQSACLAICLCLGLLSVYVLSYHLCSTVKQAQPSSNEMQTMICKWICMKNGAECLNGWQTMCDNDVLWGRVWVWISNKREREYSRVCALLSFKYGF